MWTMECFVIAVIIGATGSVTKGLKTCVEAMPREHPVDSLLKTVVLGTSHIRKVLQSEA
jgi:hypothetical protein